MEEQQDSIVQSKTISIKTIFWGLCLIIIGLVGIIGFLIGKENNIGHVSKDMNNRMICFSRAGCDVIVTPQGIQNNRIVQYFIEVNCSENPSDILDRCGILPIGQSFVSEE